MSRNFPELEELFEDQYLLEAIIGKGGFARIYRAKQTDLGRPVALKVLKHDGDDDNDTQTAVERFQREAQLIAGLRDPHTITLHDHGRTDDGLWYLVFEYIDGRSLREIRLQSGPISPRRVAKILRQVLMSLEEAHAQGVLHRDIKPANIMLYDHLGRHDQVKVLDFGIAKSVLEDDDERFQQDLTETGKILGTPRYMAPEQLQGEEARPASDLYSLGLVSYELLTGERAVQTSSLVDTVAEHVTGNSIRLPEWLDLTGEFRSTIERMVEKDVEDRYRHAEEVLEDLEDLDFDRLASQPAPTTDPQILDTRTDEIPSESEVETETAGPRGRRYSWVVAVAGAAIVLLGIGGYVVGFSVSGTDDDREPPKRSNAPTEREHHIDVETVPPGARVRLDDEWVGRAPVEVTVGSKQFPVRLRAEDDRGRSVQRRLDGARANVELRLPPRDLGSTADTTDVGPDAKGGPVESAGGEAQPEDERPRPAEAQGGSPPPSETPHTDPTDETSESGAGGSPAARAGGADPPDREPPSQEAPDETRERSDGASESPPLEEQTQEKSGEGNGKFIDITEIEGE